MAEISKDIFPDVARKNNFRVILAKQFDENSRYLRAEINNDGRRINIGKNCSVLFNVKRADGKMRAILGSVNADGTVRVPLTEWLLSVVGTSVCSISIIEGEENKLTTMSFEVQVEQQEYIENGDITEDENYDILVDLIAEVTELKNDTTEATEGANKATELANSAADAANSAAKAAREVAEGLENAAERAETATENANNAAKSASDNAQKAETSARNADSAAERANTAAGEIEGAVANASEALKQATDAAKNAEQATTDAQAAVSAANEAIEKADTSSAAAEKATENANNAANKALDAVTSIESSVEKAEQAVKDAETATTTATAAATSATKAGETATQAAEQCNTATEGANSAASAANSAATKADTAAGNAEKATAEANKWANVTATAKTLDAGAEATATLTETEDGKQFEFGIPKGEKGDTADLSKYATKEELNNKVDKDGNKQLSTNDYTTEDKEKLAGIEMGAIEAEIKEVEDKVDGISIGGKNLLPYTQNLDKTWVIGNNASFGDGYNGLKSVKATRDPATIENIIVCIGLNNYKLPIQTNTYYTLSFYAKGTSCWVYAFYSPSLITGGITSQGETITRSDGGCKFTLTNEFKRYWVTYLTKSTIDSETINISVGRLEGNNVDNVEVCGVKLERGNKATDWSPAPEDLDNEIKAVDEKLNNDTLFVGRGFNAGLQTDFNDFWAQSGVYEIHNAARMENKPATWSGSMFCTLVCMLAKAGGYGCQMLIPTYPKNDYAYIRYSSEGGSSEWTRIALYNDITATNFSGVLPVAKGGTGFTSLQELANALKPYLSGVSADEPAEMPELSESPSIEQAETQESAGDEIEIEQNNTDDIRQERTETDEQEEQE